MKTVSLSGSLRENVGKKDAATLRKAGRIPAVLYGGTEQIHFHVGELEVKKLIFSPDAYEVQLDLNGKKYRSIMKDIQFHPVSDRPVHIDFLQMFEEKEIAVQLPVRTVGNSVGVINGGRLAVNFRTLTVSALPNALPESIEINITKLKIGQDVRVKNINLEGCRILQPDNAVVVAVKLTRAAMSASVDDEEDEENTEGGEAAPAAEGEAPAEA